MAVCGISMKGNPEQQELFRLIMERRKKIVFVLGKAGTGKNFITVATAIELLRQKKYHKIYYTRDVVQAGENIGFLKGSIADKTDPFLCPLYETLESLEHKGGVIRAREWVDKIEFLPIFNVRGRNIASSLIIIDEAQNLSLKDIRTLLTRGDEWTKIIMMGSFNQIDNRHQQKKPKCDFQVAVERLEEQPFVGKVELLKSMRSDWCTVVDDLLREDIDEVENKIGTEN